MCSPSKLQPAPHGCISPLDFLVYCGMPHLLRICFLHHARPTTATKIHLVDFICKSSVATSSSRFSETSCSGFSWFWVPPLNSLQSMLRPLSSQFLMYIYPSLIHPASCMRSIYYGIRVGTVQLLDLDLSLVKQRGVSVNVNTQHQSTSVNQDSEKPTNGQMSSEFRGVGVSTVHLWAARVVW